MKHRVFQRCVLQAPVNTLFPLTVPLGTAHYPLKNYRRLCRGPNQFRRLPVSSKYPIDRLIFRDSCSEPLSVGLYLLHRASSWLSTASSGLHKLMPAQTRSSYGSSTFCKILWDKKYKCLHVGMCKCVRVHLCASVCMSVLARICV